MPDGKKFPPAVSRIFQIFQFCSAQMGTNPLYMGVQKKATAAQKMVPVSKRDSFPLSLSGDSFFLLSFARKIWDSHITTAAAGEQKPQARHNTRKHIFLLRKEKNSGNGRVVGKPRLFFRRALIAKKCGKRRRVSQEKRWVEEGWGGESWVLLFFEQP